MKIEKTLCYAALGAAAFVALAASSDANAARTPAFRFGEATLLDPASSAVSSHYGASTTHTTGHGAGRSDEIKSLAAGLDHDPDLIYEYVYENVDYHPTFGLAKGALGAHLDKSGTAFDQAHLVSELLDEARLNGANVSNIRIHYGTLALSSAAEIEEWLGLSDAGDVCRLLANGGVPATVNGSTTCGSLGGAATSLTVAHSWVKATVDGTAKTYDAAYKTYDDIAPLTVSGQDFRDALGGSCTGSALGTSGAPSQTGTTAGSPFAKFFNDANIRTKLDQCSQSLWNWIETNMPEASVEDIVGGRRIRAWNGTSISLNLSRYNSARNWAAVPDQYRLKFTVSLDPGATGTNSVNIDLFADEIAGKRVALNPSAFDDRGIAGDLPVVDEALCGTITEYNHRVRLTINGADVPGVGYQRRCAPFIRGAGVTISADAPYAADGGAYMDTDYDYVVTLATRAVLALGVGDNTADGTRHASRGMGLDRGSAGFFAGRNGGSAVIPSGPGEFEPHPSLARNDPVSENVRHRIFMAWLEQFTRLSDISAAMSDTVVQHHYTIG
ncbi:MAG: hypothetical protein AAGJ87_10040, partial [Pseudomonadota bacterium]